MSDHGHNEDDLIRSLIAKILDAENCGKAVDRDELLVKYPEHANSLLDFFASRDREKSAANLDTPTLPPDPSVENPTIPPSNATEDPTIPPGETAPAARSVGDEFPQFGDYELLDEIARGGMGVVFKARQITLNRTVALKMILAGQFASDDDIQRFATEAEAAAQLDHPGIVPIFEIGEHAGQHFFSMGYIEGESLAQQIADGPLPPRDAAEMVKKISDAMDYAHRRGVIHRDLKPANILIDGNRQPKVTDFGLAKRLGSDSGMTSTGQILGTPSYMAPEQASGNVKEIGPLADVYALGAVLYCLLTGRPPFQAATPMDTLMQVLEADAAPIRLLNDKVDRDLDAICLKCLEKDPSLRYQSASALGVDLDHFLRGEPISARSINLIERISSTLGRSQIDSGYESWASLLLWFSLLVPICQVALFLVISSRQSLPIVLGTQLAQFVLMLLVLVSHRTSDLVPRNAAQKQLWTIWLGYLISCGMIVVVSIVLLGIEPMYEYFLYPYWSILSGLAFCFMGSSHWGKYYSFAVAFLLGGLLCALVPSVSPLLFGGLWGLSLSTTALRLRHAAERSRV